MAAFDKIQQGILFMILNSEGEKIKYLTGPPPRERKYGLIAFSQLLQEYAGQLSEETITKLVRSLLELCAS